MFLMTALTTLAGTKNSSKAAAVAAPAAKQAGYVVMNAECREVSRHETLEDAKLYVAAYGVGYWVMSL